jgi:hypothetical protein
MGFNGKRLTRRTSQWIIWNSPTTTPWDLYNGINQRNNGFFGTKEIPLSCMIYNMELYIPLSWFVFVPMLSSCGTSVPPVSKYHNDGEPTIYRALRVRTIVLPYLF